MIPSMIWRVNYVSFYGWIILSIFVIIYSKGIVFITFSFQFTLIRTYLYLGPSKKGYLIYFSFIDKCQIWNYQYLRNILVMWFILYTKQFVLLHYLISLKKCASTHWLSYSKWTLLHGNCPVYFYLVLVHRSSSSFCYRCASSFMIFIFVYALYKYIYIFLEFIFIIFVHGSELVFKLYVNLNLNSVVFNLHPWYWWEINFHMYRLFMDLVVSVTHSVTI